MKNIKYLLLSAVLIGFSACNDEEDFVETMDVALPALTAGSADFSNYVALGNSLTAGFTDAALFIAAQENSLPNILSNKFALAGGGSFTQPLMNDNFGGIAIGGNRLPGFNPRLVLGDNPADGPMPLESVIGPVTVSTDLALNNPTGPFSNMGVPGAKSYHLLAPGYGNINGLFAMPATANPYFVRMTGATPDASVLDLSMAQSPSFFSLWPGENDVLGYALTGGSGIDPITDQPTFDFAINTLVSALTSGGAKGVMANIPYVTMIPHFTTVPHNPVPLDAGTAGLVNQAFAQYNGGLQLALAGSLIDADEAAARTIVFAEAEDNAVVIEDESLTNLSGLGLPNYRQATASDLLVLSSSTFIGTTVGGNPTLINGVTVPLSDQWVLIPSEQDEISVATDNFNATIFAAASQAGLAFVDTNMLMQQLDAGGFTDGDFTLTSSLVTGGAFSLDGVHPTARGYALIANEFMKAIDATYGSNFEASGSTVDIGNYPTNYDPELQ